MGDLDDTLIFYIWGDNGASMEGTVTGSFNEMTFLNGVVLDADQQLALIEQYGGIEALGGDHTAPHIAAAWAHAGNTPFQWGKQMASHLGGTRNGMVVSWPKRIQGATPRSAPSSPTSSTSGRPFSKLIGIPEPKTVDGIAQEPMDGTSFAYTFDDADGRRPPHRAVLRGPRRAGHLQGRLVGLHAPRQGPVGHESRRPCKRFAPGVFDPDNGRLGAVRPATATSRRPGTSRPSIPDRLRELQDLFWAEAERNRALPLLAGFSIFFGILPPLPTVTRFTFTGDVQNVQRGMVPRIQGRSYSIEADLLVPDGGAEGVIVANADFIGGFALWVDGQGHLCHTYSFLGVETYKQVSTEPIPSGAVSVRMLFEADEPKPGSAGRVTLWANDRQIGEGRLEHTVPVAFSSYSGMDIGRDNGLVVDLAYEDKAPYAFTGTVKQVVFDLHPTTHEDAQALHEHAAIQAVGAGAAG